MSLNCKDFPKRSISVLAYVSKKFNLIYCLYLAE
jgi:hypothetical protein